MPDSTFVDDKTKQRADLWRLLGKRKPEAHLWMPMSGEGVMLEHHLATSPKPLRWPVDRIRACDRDVGVNDVFKRKFGIEPWRGEAEKHDFGRVLYAAADIDAYLFNAAYRNLHRFMTEARLAARVGIALTIPFQGRDVTYVFDFDEGKIIRNRILRAEITKNPRARALPWLQQLPKVRAVHEVGFVHKQTDRSATIAYWSFVVERDAEDAEPPPPPADGAGPIRPKWDVRPRVLPLNWLNG